MTAWCSEPLLPTVDLNTMACGPVRRTVVPGLVPAPHGMTNLPPPPVQTPVEAQADTVFALPWQDLANTGLHNAFAEHGYDSWLVMDLFFSYYLSYGSPFDDAHQRGGFLDFVYNFLANLFEEDVDSGTADLDQISTQLDGLVGWVDDFVEKIKVYRHTPLFGFIDTIRHTGELSLHSIKDMGPDAVVISYSYTRWEQGYHMWGQPYPVGQAA